MMEAEKIMEAIAVHFQSTGAITQLQFPVLTVNVSLSSFLEGHIQYDIEVSGHITYCGCKLTRSGDYEILDLQDPTVDLEKWLADFVEGLKAFAPGDRISDRNRNLSHVYKWKDTENDLQTSGRPVRRRKR